MAHPLDPLRARLALAHRAFVPAVPRTVPLPHRPRPGAHPAPARRHRRLPRRATRRALVTVHWLACASLLYVLDLTRDEYVHRLGIVPAADALPVVPITPGIVSDSHPADLHVAPLRLSAQRGRNYLVQVDNLDTGARIEVYVEGNTTQNILVPAGAYEIRWISGIDWKGHEHLFGSSTRRIKARDTFVFEEKKNEWTGHEIDLTISTEGNLDIFQSQ